MLKLNEVVRGGTATVPIFMMCLPKHYGIPDPCPQNGHFNDQSKPGWEIYKRDPLRFQKEAMHQWFVLKNTLENQFNAQIALVEPLEGMHDQVFTADASLSLVGKSKKISFISCFTHPKRQLEAKAHKELLKGVFLNRNIVPLHTPLEGAGDNLYDGFRDLYWSGYSKNLTNPAAGRSDRKTHVDIHTVSGVNVISLQVKRPFFHIDTSFAPLSKGHILLYKEGIHSKSHAKIRKEALEKFDLEPDEYIIEVSDEDAHRYACNVINVDDKIIMPKCSARLKNTLRAKGYQVYEIDLSYFLLGGGGPHCLTNYLNHQRTVQQEEVEHCDF